MFEPTALSFAKDWVVKNGYKKYVKIGRLDMGLDYDRLERDVLYDGKWALISNVSSDIVSCVCVQSAH